MLCADGIIVVFEDDGLYGWLLGFCPMNFDWGLAVECIEGGIIFRLLFFIDFFVINTFFQF